MNKWKLRLIAVAMFLIAPPIGLLLYTLSMAVMSYFKYEDMTFDRLIHSFKLSQILYLLPTAYTSAFLPVLFVIIYSYRVVIKNKPYRIWFAHNIAILLSILPLLPLPFLHFSYGSLLAIFIIALIASTTFFVLFEIGKKLLKFKVEAKPHEEAKA